MSSVEERAFVERIRLAPREDGPRLVYADWLDEQGQLERADFIRLQCALASLSAQDPRCPQLRERERILLEQYGDYWAARLKNQVAGWEFHRGMIEAVAMEARRFIRFNRPLFQMFPIRRVRVFDVGMLVKEVAHARNLALIRELDVCGEPLGNLMCQEIAQSERASLLEVLELGHTDLTEAGLQSIAQSPNAENLRVLNLNDNPRIAAAGLRSLSDSEYLTDLEAINLSGNGMVDHHLSALLSGPVGQQLQQLVVINNPIGDPGLKILFESRVFARMIARSQTIHLTQVGMGRSGMIDLLKVRSLEKVETMILDFNVIRDEGMFALAGSDRFRNLRSLSLRKNQISDDGINALARSSLIDQLRILDLSGNSVTQSSIKRLYQASAEHDWRNRLEVIIDSDLKPRPLLVGPAAYLPQ